MSDIVVSTEKPSAAAALDAPVVAPATLTPATPPAIPVSPAPVRPLAGPATPASAAPRGSATDPATASTDPATVTPAAPTRMRRFLLGPALSVGFVVMWTGGYIAGPIGVTQADPLTLCFWRFAVAAVGLALLAVVTRAPWPKGRSAWGQIIAAGLLMQAGMFSFCYLGLALGAPVALVAIAIGASPVLVAVGGTFALAERLSPLQWGGTLLGFGGLAVAIAGEWTGEVGGAAALLPLAATIAFAAGTLVQRRTGARMDLRTGAAVQMTVASLVTLPLALVFEGGISMPVNGTSVGVVAFLAVGNSGIAAALTFLMLRHRKAADSTRLMLLVTPLATLSAWPLFGQRPSMLLWTGLAVTIVGIILATRQPTGTTGGRVAAVARTVSAGGSLHRAARAHVRRSTPIASAP
jgi:drug/metabolite transporter (DMT)-like permease